ncbi:response regulator transcription factor [Streptomyces sp. AV19]|uniref:response regulator n=1 Tax=Streptomyces sp. AV19 TaxID=2793068 RepID=UPI0018FE0856|nr:response regulator transcription factor [Streptomyces sp. AV19]MBH1939071.1 response regulator transcription factor [Streptomyces sp. AV19]MDG4534272.1 response regulator transcription factor [Streptomyces sp. AV19]
MISVVVVGDDSLACGTLRRILETADDIRALATCDVTSAVEEVARQRPDVVLLDISGPGVDGLATLSSLAAQERPPVVAMLTTASVDDRVIAALELGAVGFLFRDTEPEGLVNAVRLLASGTHVLFQGVADRVVSGFLAGRRHCDAAQAQRARLAVLTAREREVLALVGEGLSNPEICRMLLLSKATVKEHVSSILNKLGVANRLQAAVLVRTYADREVTCG